MQEHRRVQPFRWGILLAFDDQAGWEMPAASGNAIAASPTCLTVPVLQAQDFDIPEDVDPDTPPTEAQVAVTVIVGGVLDSAADFVAVPAGQLRVSVTREPVEFAAQVGIQVVPVG